MVSQTANDPLLDDFIDQDASFIKC
jgi:hypothetical protein